MSRSALMAQRIAAASSGTVVVPVQPSELDYNFATRAPGNIHGSVADSGQTMQVLASTASIAVSPIDSAKVAVGAATCYITTASPMNTIVYQWARFRFRKPAGKTNATVGLIPYTTTSPSTSDSGAHIVCEASDLLIQVVTNGSVSSAGVGPFTHTDLGQGWREVEWAIYGNACVLRDSDGVTHSYTHAQLLTDLAPYPVFEPFFNPSTTWIPEFSHIRASSFTGMSTGQKAYYNALLATQGYGPA